MARRAVQRGDVRLSDGRATACGTDHKGRLRLVASGVMGHPVQQRHTHAAKATLGIADRLAGAPADRACRERIRDPPVSWHVAARALPGSDDEIGAVAEQCQAAGNGARGVLAIRIERDNRVDWRSQLAGRRDAADERRALPRIALVPEHGIGAGGARGGEGVVGGPIIDDDDVEGGRDAADSGDDCGQRRRRLVGRDHARRAHATRGPPAVP